MAYKLSDLPEKVRRKVQEQIDAEDGKKNRVPKPGKRLRQSKPVEMNELERKFYWSLVAATPQETKVHFQAKTYKLANGVTYTPDFVVTACGIETAYEVKGPWFTDDARVKIKVAAREFPEVFFILVWVAEDSGNWCHQRVLP